MHICLYVFVRQLSGMHYLIAQIRQNSAFYLSSSIICRLKFIKTADIGIRALLHLFGEFMQRFMRAQQYLVAEIFELCPTRMTYDNRSGVIDHRPRSNYANNNNIYCSKS